MNDTVNNTTINNQGNEYLIDKLVEVSKDAGIGKLHFNNRIHLEKEVRSLEHLHSDNTTKIRQLEEEVKTYKEKYELYRKSHDDFYDKWQYWMNRFERLVRLINKNKIYAAGDILKRFYNNEAKLKAKRGKK